MKKEWKFNYIYDLNATVKEKIETIARVIYGAQRIVFSIKAERDIEKIEARAI